MNLAVDSEFTGPCLQFAHALALSTFDVAATEFGLSVNFKKTKFWVEGYGIAHGDYYGAWFGCRAYVFLCLHLSVLTPNARSSADIRRPAQASSAFDFLRGVLVDDSLSFATRRQLYNACVLSVLLYRSECLDATVF